MWLIFDRLIQAKLFQAILIFPFKCCAPLITHPRRKYFLILTFCDSHKKSSQNIGDIPETLELFLTFTASDSYQCIAIFRIAGM